MKVKDLYKILLVVFLISACSQGAVPTNQSVESPVTQTVEILSAITQDQDPKPEEQASMEEVCGLGQGPDGRTPPQEALNACDGKSEGDICEFNSLKAPRQASAK